MKFPIGVLAAVAALFAVPARAGDDDWHRAESAHFVVYSDGDRDQLVEFTRDLEKFDGLLRFWFAKPDHAGQAKLPVYLLDRERKAGDLLGSNRVAGFYSASAEGTYAVSPRNQRVLFHEYAHHFLFNEFSEPVPAWLVEGFAEFMSTVEFGSDGSWTYGKPVEHRASQFRRFSNPNIEIMLTDPNRDRSQTTGLYAWAWALTHMLYTAPDRGARISAYVDRLAAGEDSLTAARSSFGDLDELARQMRQHVKGRVDYSVSTETFPWKDDIEVSPVAAEDGRLIMPHLQWRSWNQNSNALKALKQLVATDTSDADLWAELGMAQFREAAKQREQGNSDDESLAEAEKSALRALSLDETNVRANLLMGRILSGRLLESEDDDADAWKAARRYFQVANRAEPGNAEALYRFALSYAQEGREGPMMFDAFASAYKIAPQVRSYRMGLAFDLARLGRYDDAIALLVPVTNDPHFPEAGRSAVRRIEAMRASGAKFPPKQVAETTAEKGED